MTVAVTAVHRASALMKRWILGTHQGAVSKELLGYYLAEFAFRYNRRYSRHRGLLFYRLAEQAMQTEPQPYVELLTRPARKRRKRKVKAAGKKRAAGAVGKPGQCPASSTEETGRQDNEAHGQRDREASLRCEGKAGSVSGERKIEADVEDQPYAHPVRQPPGIYLITGPMAAGKSTVARLLASRFERGVCLEGDVFRRSIVSGRVEMTPDPSSEAVEQLRLRYQLAATAADGYFEAGFNVALEDVVAGPLLGDWRMMLRSRPCHIIVLLPSIEAVVAREAERAQSGYGAWTVEQVYEGFVSGTPRVGVWLDTTHLTPEETVAEILAQTSSTRTPIVISDYDANWPLQFDEIAQPVRKAVADLGATVEHIGSTSVPGLAAKPIIDIDVAVASSDDVPTAIERLRSLGYLYQGDKGIKGREAFMWPSGAPPHHLYVVVQGNESHRRHIAFRNYLREHPEVARDYAALKTRLAEQHGEDRLGYTDAKDEFVAQVLRAAGA